MDEKGEERMNGNAGKASPIVAWIIHFAFLLSVPIYSVVTTFILAPQASRSAPPGDPGLFLAVLGGVAVVNIILALTAERWLDKVNPTRKLNQPEGSAAGYMERAITRLTVVDAFYEAIAIYGLVGQFLGFKLWQSYIFMGVGFLALLIRIAAVRNITDTYSQLKGSEEIG
jgi:hypothetical protein